MDKAKLDRLRELAQAATPGPWYAAEQRASIDPSDMDAHFHVAVDPTTVLWILDRIAELDRDCVGRAVAHVHTVACVNAALDLLSAGAAPGAVARELLRPSNWRDDAEPPLL